MATSPGYGLHKGVNGWAFMALFKKEPRLIPAGLHCVLLFIIIV
jgi:hypothetical protein